MEFDTFYKFITKQIHGFGSAFMSINENVNIIEIVFLALFLLFLYKKYIKGTSSENLIRGIFALIFLWVLSGILIKLNLQILGMFLQTLVGVVSFGLIVIFQPELRKFLGYLGQANWFSKMFLSKKPSKSGTQKDTIKELIETIKYLSKWKIGGLIVLNKGDNNFSYSDVGTKVNADISQELLLTIFHPKTPLHDGAVVISNNKIILAGVLLPLTDDPKLSWRYGTRHRAALGISEATDCACIVVSEETGDVSIAIDGQLKKYEDLGQLKADLERILAYEEEDDKGISRQP